MAWTSTTVPNLTDYRTWLYTIVGPVASPQGTNFAQLLPPNTSTIQASLDTAVMIVAEQLGVGCPPAPALTLSIYVQAVYCLATDRLFNWAPDVSGQHYFEDKRAMWGIFTLSVGVASSASDQGTSASMLNPEQMRLFTLQDLQTLKTPWGRQYMAYAQMYGRNLWGLT